MIIAGHILRDYQPRAPLNRPTTHPMDHPYLRPDTFSQQPPPYPTQPRPSHSPDYWTTNGRTQPPQERPPVEEHGRVLPQPGQQQPTWDGRPVQAPYDPNRPPQQHYDSRGQPIGWGQSGAAQGGDPRDPYRPQQQWDPRTQTGTPPWSQPNQYPPAVTDRPGQWPPPSAGGVHQGGGDHQQYTKGWENVNCNVQHTNHNSYYF